MVVECWCSLATGQSLWTQLLTPHRGLQSKGQGEREREIGLSTANCQPELLQLGSSKWLSSRESKRSSLKIYFQQVHKGQNWGDSLSVGQKHLSDLGQQEEAHSPKYFESQV